MDKFLGIGLTNALGLWCLFFLISLVVKVIFTTYEVEGLSEVIRAGAQKGGVRMNQLFSPKWWMNQFISCFITMCFIYLIKMIAGNWNIPFVSNVAEAV